MKKIRYILIIYGSFLFCDAVAQQDPQYSQYMFNHLVLNPAYAGSKEALDASMFIRSQWTGIKGAPNTQTLSVHSPLKKRKVGVGIAFIADQIGPKKSVGVLGSYSYKIKLYRGKLAFGLRAGIYNYKYNWSDINYKDQGDLYNTQNSTNQIAPTADAGVYYYTNSMYVGFSSTHLFNGRIVSASNLNGDFAKLSPHSFFTFGKAWAFSDRFIFNPSLLIKSAVGSPASVDLNFSGLIDEKLWVGFSFRSAYGVVMYTQYRVYEKLKIGYSFDIGFNRIGRAGGLSHEIMVGYELNLFNSKMLSPRYL